MKSAINTDTWVRKEHYHFFRKFEEPFFGVTINVDCTNAYRVVKAEGASFFLYYLHASLVAANATAPFRYRMAGEEVWEYDTVNASPTINRPDGTFGFSYMDYHADFNIFAAAASMEIERVQAGTGLVPAVSGENVIHYSSIPWLNFTGLSHARAFSFADSCPKIAFGKMTTVDGRRQMSVSVHVHHALMDGFHVGQFVTLFQEALDR